MDGSDTRGGDTSVLDTGTNGDEANPSGAAAAIAAGNGGSKATALSLLLLPMSWVAAVAAF